MIKNGDFLLPTAVCMLLHFYSLWLIFLAWKKPNKFMFVWNEQLRNRMIWRIKLFGPIFSLVSLTLAVSFLFYVYAG